jgi:adenylate cyclase
VRARQRRLRLALLAAVAVVAGGGAAALQALGALHRVELSTVDGRLSVRGHHSPRSDVVLVGLDSRTISALGRPPLPRSVHARVMDRLHAAGARVIAYDLRFQSATEPRQDRALIAAVSRNRPVVLATFDPGGKPIPVPAGYPHPERIGAVLASIAVPTDSDGRVRKLLYAPIRLPTLPVKAAGIALGRPVQESRFEQNMAWVDYPGPPGTVPTYSLVDVLRGRVPRRTFAGKVVVVGPTDPIEKDLFNTPTSDSPMFGPEVQVNAIATILSGFPLRSSSAFLNTVLLAATALLGPLLGLRRSALLVLLGAAGALGLFLVGAQLAFNSGQVLHVAAPVLALLAGSAGTLIVHYAMVTRERRHLRGLFARFVPPQVVDEVIERVDEDLRLGGVRRDGTVMFCDLRGFTAFSEELEPEQVVEVVNRYLSEMTEAILAHGGTLVSYMGDGIMALFGAPIEQPDHAVRAVGAAREMLAERLPRFNAWLREQRMEQQFRMGIGLNSGLVMSGNVGSEQRLEYTALGDTTNTAARLEGMTKGTDHQVYLAESTRERLEETSDVVFVGEFEVRGRQRTLRVWTLGEQRSRSSSVGDSPEPQRTPTNSR